LGTFSKIRNRPFVSVESLGAFAGQNASPPMKPSAVFVYRGQAIDMSRIRDIPEIKPTVFFRSADNQGYARQWFREEGYGSSSPAERIA
jgi:hypothetical protein